MTDNSIIFWAIVVVLVFSALVFSIGYGAGHVTAPLPTPVATTTVSLLQEDQDCKKKGGNFGMSFGNGVPVKNLEEQYYTGKVAPDTSKIEITCDVTTLDKTITL